MSNQKYPSTVRTANFTGDDNPRTPGAKGLVAFLDATVVPGVDTVQLVIEGKDSLSGKYYTILSAAARVATGTDVLRVYPGIAVTANVSASDVIPDFYRVRVVHSAGTSFTYSVSVNEVF